MKHTKGPWTASIAGPKHSIHIYKPMLKDTVETGREGDIIAEIGNHDNYNEANAHLIAAAPEMFELLLKILANIDAPDNNFYELGELYKTIKKARGDV